MKVDQKTRISEPLRKRLVGVGQLLRSARIGNRLTQDEAATTCNVSRQTVSRIERGDPSVAWGQVARFADAMGVADLLGGETPSDPEAAGRRVRAPKAKLEALPA
jgi:DNA-binding XRE family transcriptional regulator